MIHPTAEVSEQLNRNYFPLQIWFYKF